MSPFYNNVMYSVYLTIKEVNYNIKNVQQITKQYNYENFVNFDISNKLQHSFCAFTLFLVYGKTSNHTFKV